MSAVRGEVYEEWQLEQRAAESGRSLDQQREHDRRGEEERRRYEYGRAQVAAEIRAWNETPQPGVICQPEPMPAFTAALAPRVIAKGDRGTWARNTLPGQLRAVASPDEPDEAAREMAAARAFIDDWEYRYNRRPSMAEARMAVGRRSDGFQFTGTVAELGRIFAMAGARFATTAEVLPLPGPGEVVTQSVRPG